MCGRQPLPSGFGVGITTNNLLYSSCATIEGRAILRGTKMKKLFTALVLAACMAAPTAFAQDAVESGTAAENGTAATVSTPVLVAAGVGVVALIAIVAASGGGGDSSGGGGTTGTSGT